MSKSSLRIWEDAIAFMGDKRQISILDWSDAMSITSGITQEHTIRLELGKMERAGVITRLDDDHWNIAKDWREHVPGADKVDRHRRRNQTEMAHERIDSLEKTMHRLERELNGLEERFKSSPSSSPSVPEEDPKALKKLREDIRKLFSRAIEIEKSVTIRDEELRGTKNTLNQLYKEHKALMEKVDALEKDVHPDAKKYN